jgi:hypothetical protein
MLHSEISGITGLIPQISERSKTTPVPGFCPEIFQTSADGQLTRPTETCYLIPREPSEFFIFRRKSLISRISRQTLREIRSPLPPIAYPPSPLPTTHIL